MTAILSRLDALETLAFSADKKIARLEAFIRRKQEAGTWDMIGESSLQETIRDTISQDFFVPPTSELSKNFKEE